MGSAREGSLGHPSLARGMPTIQTIQPRLPREYRRADPTIGGWPLRTRPDTSSVGRRQVTKPTPGTPGLFGFCPVERKTGIDPEDVKVGVLDLFSKRRKRGKKEDKTTTTTTTTAAAITTKDAERKRSHESRPGVGGLAFN